MSGENTGVLVVGGSLVGLSTALFLSMNELPCVLVDPHARSHPHPRAIGYTPRTLEVLHTAGITLPEVPRGFRLSRARVESLAGEWHDATEWTPKKPAAAPPPPSDEASPYVGAAIAQDLLEPKLREGARARGADLRLGTELVSFTQDAAGVTALLRERASGREYEMRADYMIACDGNRSSVREALGIERRGPGLLQVMRSVLFRAPLEQYLARGVSQFEIGETFLTTYGDGRWVLMFKDDVERDEATLRAAIQRAIGRTDLPIEIITTGRWELTALIAERFREGRVFLAGDAAHTLPPTRGGYGANTGIHDAHNLAWKLKAVRDGADAALLETYDAERRPIAWTRLEQTFARPDYAAFARGFADGVEILDETAIELGQLYRTLADDPSLPEAARPNEWRGQPGTRAPHVKLDDGTSTLEWFGHGWALVAGSAEALQRISEIQCIGPLQCIGSLQRIDPARRHVASEGVRAAFGLGPHGIAVVRPDGYIAWRKTA